MRFCLLARSRLSKAMKSGRSCCLERGFGKVPDKIIGDEDQPI
jgi:hypothetical protein